MPQKVSGKKYRNARNGQEILWNTTIFLASGKWLEGCRKNSAGIVLAVLAVYARLNFAAGKA